MSFLNDIFEHRSSISSIRMVREPRASTSSAADNENSLDELIVNAVSEENNRNEFPLPSVSPINSSCRSTPTQFERKKRKSSGNYDEYDKILLEALKKRPEPNPIDCFMVRLAEGMRRLPYKLPRKQVPRRIPFQMRGEVDKVIEEMRACGAIEESNSPWISPVVLRRKKDGTIRFCVDYRKGLVHKNADGLSRRVCESFGCEYCAKVERKNSEAMAKGVARIVLTAENPSEWRLEQRGDPSILIILRGKEAGVRPPRAKLASEDVSAQIYWSYWDALVLKEGILYKRWEAPNLKFSFLQLVVPRRLVKGILEELHDSPTGEHFGVNKTLEKIRKRYYWATCKQDVEDWCRSCKICVARKGPSGKGRSPLQVYNVGAPLERVQMDILGPLPVTKSGNRFLLVIVDCFTKWVEVFLLKNMRAKLVAEVFVNQFVSRHGVPTEVHTDQGRNFESRLFSELMRLFGIRKTRTTALHPQSDGQVERQHQTITNYLAKYVSENQKDWDQWIPMFLLAYRSSKHETTGATPSELYFARDLRLPTDLLRGSLSELHGEEAPLTENFVRNLKERLEVIHSSAWKQMNMKSTRMKARYDRGVRQVLFQEGQRVWFYNPRRVRGKTPKLQRNWEGPFLIVKKLNDVVYCIQKSPRHRSKIVHSDRGSQRYARRCGLPRQNIG